MSDVSRHIVPVLLCLLTVNQIDLLAGISVCEVFLRPLRRLELVEVARSLVQHVLGSIKHLYLRHIFQIGVLHLDGPIKVASGRVRG